MAKIYFTHTEDLKDIVLVLSNYLKKNSGHRMAIYEEQADFVLDFTRDWAGGSKGLDLLIYSDDDNMINLGKSITNTFKNEGLLSQYPKKGHKDIKRPTLTIRVGRVNQDVDFAKWAALIGEGIVKYFNPEYISQPTNEVKPSEDKTYYDRSFNQNATNNASLIFKKN